MRVIAWEWIVVVTSESMQIRYEIVVNYLNKKLGLRRDIHRKNYLEIKTSLAEQMPELLQNQSILQHVTITNKEYATKYKLRKDKIQIHPGINLSLIHI